MLRNFVLYLATLTFAVSCSNLDNQSDQERLLCGESVGESYALIRIESVEDFDAILVKDGDVRRAVKTEKSCVSIAAEDREYRLLVRDGVSRTKTLHLNAKDIRPGLSTFSLTEDQEGKRFQTQARCPSSEIQVSKELEIFFKRSDSDQVSYPMVRISVTNSQNASVLQTTRVLGDDIPALPLDLPDGSYKLEMKNFDAFDVQSPDVTVPETCTLVVDRNSPSVELKVERAKGFEDRADTFTITPAAKLEFAVEQEAGFEVSVCLKKRQDEGVQVDVCDLAEFKNVGSTYNAPDGGAWDLYAYARDRAGNRSSVKHFKLNVYHEALVSEIHALSKTISLMVKDGQEYNAFKSLKKLILVAKKLEIKTELRDVYWQLLAHFHWAATKNSLIWEQQFNDINWFDGDSANHSLYEDSWAVAGYKKEGDTETDPSFVYHHGELSRIPTRYEEFQFLPDNRMVGIRQDPLSFGMILEIFENRRVIESKKFDRFYEDVFIDHQLKVFVLVGYANLLLVKMENLDDQRVISLPDAARPAEHGGMELKTSPDSVYYYISVATNLLRVHIASGDVQVYKDPLCWIEKAVVAPTGDVYYTGMSRDVLYAKKNCQRAYRVDWDEGGPAVSTILSTDEDYDSLSIVDIQEKPFLVAFRSNHLDVMDIKTQAQYTVLIDQFAKSGSLTRHPIHGDVFYLKTDDTLYKMSLREPEPGETDQPFLLATVPMPIKGRVLNFFPTKDPGKVLLVYDRKVQIRSFQPEKIGILPISSSGVSCKMDINRSYSICLKDAKSIVRKAHLHGVEHSYQKDFEVADWELLPDGYAIFLSTAREIYIWKPNANVPVTLGAVGVDGAFSLDWYPLAQMITISHKIEKGILFDDSLTEERPRTIILTKKDGDWVISDQIYEGLPLHEKLPVVLVGRVVSNSFFYDVVDTTGVIINSSSGHVFENLTASSDFPSLFRKAEAGTIALENEPFLYSVIDGNLRKINIYTNVESPTPPIPAGHRIIGLFQSGKVQIQNLGTRRWFFINMRTGQFSENGSEDDSPVMKIWSGAISVSDHGIRVEKTGEKLDLKIREFFQTPHEFLVGYTRYEKAMTLNSIIPIDPNWMDEQLKKSQLYELQRAEIDEDDDFVERPVPSPPWH